MTKELTSPTTNSPGDSLEPDAQLEPSPGRRLGERIFTDQVIEAAHYHGWQPYHLRDRDSINIVRGRGFPDLVMYRKDPDTGQTELLAAELKRGYDSELRPEQTEWFEALGYHIPAYEWRPENWDEIERVLELGPEEAGGVKRASQRTQRPRSDTQIPANFGNAITNLAETIEAREFGPGNRAKLRRMDPDNPNTSVFWQLMSWDGMPRNPDISKWGLILHGMATMAHGAGLAHVPHVFVGQALHQGSGKRTPFYSESRLATLLAARGPALFSLLARLFRMLANEGCAFNWREMAWFILNLEDNEVRAEESRMGFARAYYQAERRSSRSTESTGE